MTAKTQSDYLGQLQALLPSGAAWTRGISAWFTRFLAGFAEEFARLDARAHQLLLETDPRTAYELLDDWENVLGLPDLCTAAATSIPDRQLACWRKLAYQAGQTPAFFIELAASIGVSIEVHEFDPAVNSYDGTLTSLITGGRWRHVWRVHVTSTGSAHHFQAGDAAGSRLVELNTAINLECIIQNTKPAHSLVIFTYPEV